MQSEWSWFRASLRDAILRPRAFARTLPREHYGLAAVLVAFLAGLALSLSIDLAVLASKSLDPAPLATTLATDAALLSVRFAVVAALLSLLARFLVRVRRRDVSLEACFTALGFAAAPLLLSPAVPALLLAAAELPRPARDAVIAGAGALALGLVGRVSFGVVVNLAALAGRRLSAAVAIATLLAAAFVLQDQVDRVTFTALTYAPGMLPPPAPEPAQGAAARADRLTFALPAEWRDAGRGIPGEVGRFETADARLIVRRVSVGPLTTAGELAAQRAGVLRRDFARLEGARRAFVNVDGLAAVEDGWHGTIGETPIAQRLYTIVLGERGYQIEFRFFRSPDEAAAFDLAARIAASIRIAR